LPHPRRAGTCSVRQVPPLCARVLDTPLGRFHLLAHPDGLAGAWFDDQTHRPDCAFVPDDGDHPWLNSASDELQRYFAGTLTVFSTPRVALWGTTFQGCVWKALADIPFSTTLSYGALAKHIGHPTAVRAVATAVSRNPWMIFLPCHRVLGSTGQLRGYAGGLARQRWLLGLEGEHRAAL
jgi:methylated-DNA-[protein]-cysteine S-methyltransferase